jgi:hypothetical protein
MWSGAILLENVRAPAEVSVESFKDLMFFQHANIRLRSDVLFEPYQGTLIAWRNGSPHHTLDRVSLELLKDAFAVLSSKTVQLLSGWTQNERGFIRDDPWQLEGGMALNDISKT